MPPTHPLAAPPYRHIFAADELDAIKACHDEHGFAVVKDVLSDDAVDRIKADIVQVLNPKDDLPAGDTRYAHWFVEKSPAMLGLLENKAFMATAARLIGTEELTVNRSAAILKSPGAAAGGWHTDFSIAASEPTFNSGEWPNGLWFYLTGSTQQNAGLAVIDGSHRPDWPGPEGFPLVEDGKYFEPADGSWSGKDPFHDVPGVVAIESAPNDLVIFAARTFHAPFAHRGNAPRFSVALVLRPSDVVLNAAQPLPPAAKKLVDSVPAHLRRYFVNYASNSATE